MSSYVVRRLLGAVTVLFGLMFFAFMATHFIGDPVSFLIDTDHASEEDVQRLREAGGYDRPVWEQFQDFMAGAVQGDFGESVYQNRPAREIVMERVPRTLQLGAAAFALTFVVAVPLAVFSARRQGRLRTTSSPE
ncbi:MAG: ABC transporter permease [Dehalococcoidia bacterium]|nr:ABC transporter permease [Dehalococcoidia bacterium]